MTISEPSFHSYADKPTALISGSYTTVRGAELRKIDQMLAAQGDDVPVSGIEERFGRFEDGNRNTDHVTDCLSLLQAFDYIELSAQDLVSRYNNGAYPDLSFEPRFLMHIRRQTGRPKHITYISEVLARLHQRRVSIDTLLEEVQADEAESYSDELSWTAEKIRFWANLLDPVGALSYTTGGDASEVVASPTRALLVELVAFYVEEADEGTRAADCFEWIDEWFIPIFAERAGVPLVSVGVADTLYSMEDDGAISLIRESDAQGVIELPKPGDGGTRTISEIAIQEVPSIAAYEYPLSRVAHRSEQ